jgi:hypothetical protein
MGNMTPQMFDEPNLSHAWGRALLHIIDNSGKEISPLVVSVTGFSRGEPLEDADIRSALDNCLVSNRKQKVHTVANTIFPQSVWRASKYNRRDLYKSYLEAVPRYKALEPSKNNRGLYFERLIAYGSGPKNSSQRRGPEDGNQLEFIIRQYKSRPRIRKSMFQASIFDPEWDHTTSAQLAFPCLQHVSFVPQGNNLIINGFYATQQIFEKAYGNYLGLCRLGNFMAHEMGLTLYRMNCFTGVEKLDTISKQTLDLLVATVRSALNKVEVKADSARKMIWQKSA